MISMYIIYYIYTCGVNVYYIIAPGTPLLSILVGRRSISESQILKKTKVIS